jgi:hypothetical protein
MRATRFTVASVSAGLGSCFMAALPVAEQQDAPQARFSIGRRSLHKPNYATDVVLGSDAIR